MNILVFHQFYTGVNEPGIDRFNLLGREWIEMGHTVTIIAGDTNYISGKKKSFRFRGFWRREKDKSGVEVVRLWSTSGGFGYGSVLGRAFTYLSFLKVAFFARLFVKKPDVIIASSPPIFIGLIAYLVSRLRKVPFIFEVRDIWPDELVELGVLKNEYAIRFGHKLEKFLYSHADSIVTNSPGIKKFLSEKKSVIEDRMEIVENPIFISDSKKNKVAYEGWKDFFVVLYSGNHGRVYDFDTLLDVAYELNKKDKNIRLVLIGDGAEKKKIRERVQRENITNVVLMKPVPKKDIGSYIDASHICVVSMRDLQLIQNVYATKLFEYMAHKKPIVLAMKGVSASLIEKAKSGVVVSPGDCDLIVRAILNLKSSVDKRKKMGESGYRYVKKYMTGHILADKYLQHILKVVDGSNKKK